MDSDVVAHGLLICALKYFFFSSWNEILGFGHRRNMLIRLYLVCEFVPTRM